MKETTTEDPARDIQTKNKEGDPKEPLGVQPLATDEIETMETEDLENSVESDLVEDHYGD